MSFNEWFKKNEKTFRGEIIYFKGLGLSDDLEIKDDMTSAPITIFKHDQEGHEYINLAFSKENAELRKRWIEEWRNIRNTIEPLTFKKDNLLVTRTTSDMMKISFPPYMIDNIFRAIPSYKDGLKKSQRQVLYYALNHWNYGSNYIESLRKGEKMVSFGSGVVSYSKYHHGDKSLYDTIVKMTRNYIGSNNLPIFRKYGQFGTRDGGGKDAADHRYIALSFPWWFSYVFNKDMVDLIPRREVDGELAEPLSIPCDIPLGLINGNLGIGTGWSSYIPPHHPIVIVDWILQRLDGKKRINPLYPFFQGYRGECHFKIKNGKETEEETIETISSDTNSYINYRLYYFR